MRLLSPKLLSAGLGLTLLAAPLAMAQSYHHMDSPHATHHMQAPVHHMVTMHSRAMPHAHVVVRRVSVRHEVVPVHHDAMHHG